MRFLLRNTIGVYGAWVVAILSGLVVTPVTLHSLGQESFGVWSFIGSVTLYLAILDLGVGPAVIRFAAEYRGRKDMDETSALASAGLAVYGVIALVSLPIGLVVAWFTPVLVGAPDDLYWDTRVATLLIVLGLAARFPLGLFGSLLVGQQRSDVQNLGNALALVVYTILVVVFLPLGAGLVALGAFSLLAGVLRLVIPLLWLRSELPGLRLRRADVTRGRLRQLASFSWSTFLVGISGRVVFSADVIVVGIVLGPVATALYAVPAKLFAIGFGVGTAGPTLLAPAFAELEGADRIDRQRELLLLAVRVGMAFILVIALPLLLIPDQLIEAWVGTGYEDSIPVMVILALVLIVHQPITLLTQYLIARNRQHGLAMVLTVASIVNVGLSIGLALAVGIWGVAFSTLIIDIAVLGVALASAAPAAEVPVRRLVQAGGRPVLPACIVALVVLVVIARLLDPSSLIALVPVGVAWVVLCAGALWLFGLNSDERRSIAQRLGARRGTEATRMHPLGEIPS